MTDTYKKTAAEAALDHIEEGMRLGLGTGSTAAHFVKALGERVANGLTVTAVATSDETDRLARQVGIDMVDFDAMPRLDLTIDGADEIAPGLSLIKGGGGALLREKIVACASDRMIVIADEGKLVRQVGAFKLPMEVVPFGLEATRAAIEAAASGAGLSGSLDVRQSANGPFHTDSGNLIVDASFGLISDPRDLENRLSLIPGLVETGLFIGIADLALIAGPDGLSVMRP